MIDPVTEDRLRDHIIIIIDELALTLLCLYCMHTRASPHEQTAPRRYAVYSLFSSV